MLRNQPGDGRATRGDLCPPHRPRATRARVNIRREHVRQQPRPPIPPGRRIILLAEQLKLIYARGRRLVGGRINRRLGHDESPAR